MCVCVCVGGGGCRGGGGEVGAEFGGGRTSCCVAGTLVRCVEDCFGSGAFSRSCVRVILTEDGHLWLTSFCLGNKLSYCHSFG